MLIIIGLMVKPSDNAAQQPMDRNIVKYIRQTKQEYFFTDYGDMSHLFLMVDLNHLKEVVSQRKILTLD